ncbi:MAG: FlgD immunoglobulin-like domain containing protein, partial [Candidatus Zipacnadales bacterium]
RRQDLDDAIAAEVTEGIIFEYVPAAGAQPGHYAFVEARSAVLEPLKGYWLHVNVSTAVVIYPATVAGGEVSKKPSASAAQPTLDNWKLQLIASAPGMLDTCNYLGVSPQASSARDVGADVPEPPALGKMLRAYFPHRNWGNASGDYTQDLRARAAAKQTWAFEVDCPTANVPVTLSWPDLNAVVPRELSVRLEDLDSGQAVSMRGSTSYTFRTIEPGVRHFEITVGPTVTASLQITTLTASMARDGSVIVTYALSAPASVSASIRNITGRPVRTLMSSREVAEGTQTLVWDARADSGVKVPLGTYLLQLSARSSEGETVQRILPIRAAR